MQKALLFIASLAMMGVSAYTPATTTVVRAGTARFGVRPTFGQTVAPADVARTQAADHTMRLGASELSQSELFDPVLSLVLLAPWSALLLRLGGFF